MLAEVVSTALFAVRTFVISDVPGRSALRWPPRNNGETTGWIEHGLEGEELVRKEVMILQHSFPSGLVAGTGVPRTQGVDA